MNEASAASQRVSQATVSSRGLLPAALTVGAIARIAPLFDQAGRLLKQWPTEDGYLTLTIARNIALGRGFSVAEGTIPTNGTQPLVTLLYAGGFWVGGGDRRLGVLLALVWQVVAALATALVLRRLVASVLSTHPRKEQVADLAAAVWLVHPILVPHTMNCLETGTVALVAVLALASWWAWQVTRDGHQGALGALRLGVWLGLLGLARIDSVFFMVALAAAHVWLAFRKGRIRSAIVELSIMAAIPALFVAPWLLFGKLTFGHWVPISGIAEGHFAEFGEHAILMPSKLLEYFLPIGIPSSLESQPLVALACLLTLVGLGALAVRSARQDMLVTGGAGSGQSGEELARQAALVFALVLGVSYGGYYGLFFGADHFLSRYWALFSLLTVPAFAYFADRFAKRLRPATRLALAGALCLVLLLQQARLYRNGQRHLHWQVVEWTRANVAPAIWVGAIQTGTLGFYHERTINLDGKVNPHALEAKLGGTHHEYIVSSPVQALIDWAGVANLLEDGPIVKSAFRIRVLDRQADLGVLVRKGGRLDVETRQ